MANHTTRRRFVVSAGALTTAALAGCTDSRSASDDGTTDSDSMDDSTTDTSSMAGEMNDTMEDGMNDTMAG